MDETGSSETKGTGNDKYLIGSLLLISKLTHSFIQYTPYEFQYGNEPNSNGIQIYSSQNRRRLQGDRWY